MPTYEYQCSKCGGTFEVFQSMKDDLLRHCVLPGCGGKKTVKRLIGAGGGIIFKGSGFYQTDYKKNGSPGKADTGPAKSPSGGKADAGSEKSPSADNAKTESAAKPGGCACGGGNCGD